MADWLLRHVCPDSPYVWNGHRFSKCFINMTFAFGVNVLTIIVTALLGITMKIGGRRRRNFQRSLLEKIFFHFLPAIGLCLSLFEMMFLLRKLFTGDVVEYHEWLSTSSLLAVWIFTSIFANCSNFEHIFNNKMLCLWWIVRAIFGIFIFVSTYADFEILKTVNSSFVVLLDVLFGTLAFIISSEHAKSSSMEDSLLYVDVDLEDSHMGNNEDKQSCWNLLTFNSVTSVMDDGAKKQLNFEDLLQLPNEMDPSFCHNKLSFCWKDQCSRNCLNPSFFWAICCAYGWSYVSLGLLKVLNDCINFVGPMLLNRLIHYLQQGSGTSDGYVLAISLGLTSIFKSFLDTQYTFHLSKLKLKLRSSVMTVIYQKCLSISIAERSQFSSGEIQTFMSVDTDRTVNLCNSFHDMWSLPLQIGVALYLLYTQVKFAFLSGIAITILLIPVNKWISELIARATEEMMKQKDERIRRTGEILTHIHTLKTHGWEVLFCDWLKKTRSQEVSYLSTRKYLDAWCVFFWATTPTLFSLFTFGLFTLMGYQLDAATVFTCLALFNTLISPLNSFPWVINGMIDAVISLRRLTRFLSCIENKIDPDRENISPSLTINNDQEVSDTAVFMSSACCSWSSSKEVEPNILLNNLTLEIYKGSFVAVIGEVGSGKTSLLSAILGEMQLLHGSVHANRSIAYVSQVPWILSGTIRENILFGKGYDSQRYQDTLWACALDIDISLMPGGDMAHIGERGVNLSGGQRARLAMARALYHGLDILMLDDVLSAVDAQVADWILRHAILGSLAQKRTRILSTHNNQAIFSADMVIVMDRGKVKWIGNPANLSGSSYVTFTPLNELDSTQCIQRQGCQVIERTETCKRFFDEKEDTNAPSEVTETVDGELRTEGRVQLSVYKNYAAFCGWFIAIIICISALLMQASRNGNDLWLSFWVDTTGRSQMDSSTTFYLVTLCIFCIINSFFTLLRAFSFAFGGLQAAVKVHDTLLNKLIHAPIQFFYQTPGGRILNRLSSDLYTIDDSLPFILNILLANFVGLLGIAVVLSYVQVFFLLLLLPFWYIYSKLQFFYRATARELRRLDSVSRSPIYSSFTETLDGSATIRAFKCEDFFFTRFTKHIILYQQTSYSEVTASLWLSLRLQLLAGLIISFIAVMAVIGSLGHLPLNIGTPGLVGLALSYAAPIVSLLGNFLTSFTETEKEMVSMERALQYMDIPQEDLHGCRSLDSKWPYQGRIEFQNVTLRYKPSLPAALRDISFTISGGAQVGIIGRTGAGKSSILNSLFRLTPVCAGRILVDGIDIAEVPVRDLRMHFAVVPQTPFLFEGSLRENLDPFHLYDDQKILEVLERCYIRREIEAAGGLDFHVKESGLSFSVGQRQLLCLVRALLKSSKVLCLDECTANIDTQTAALLQNTISNECRGMTVITIAHRISTVLNMDDILILDYGILVEQGNPQDLLENESSKFSNFVNASKM
ncbi:ABC transporter C family member 13 isoform X2 [Cucumis sativus]|uniref:ABC transporter C family member 13 isoform X2 n=1 Tax=Cucumis sativus TaxID=3659 RepID=UPI0012F4E9FE|nr:ABC transporter C family member 13 isoform X2 [Cucumis sativus]